MLTVSSSSSMKRIPSKHVPGLGVRVSWLFILKNWITLSDRRQLSRVSCICGNFLIYLWKCNNMQMLRSGLLQVAGHRVSVFIVCVSLINLSLVNLRYSFYYYFLLVPLMPFQSCHYNQCVATHISSKSARLTIVKAFCTGQFTMPCGKTRDNSLNFLPRIEILM